MQPSIELTESLWERVVKSAEDHGYSSPQSYVADVLEREVSRGVSTVSDQQIALKMEELGYLDFGRDI